VVCGVGVGVGVRVGVGVPLVCAPSRCVRMARG